MTILAIFTILFALVALLAIRASERKEEKAREAVLYLDKELICEDIENACYSVSKTINQPIIFNSLLVKELRATPIQSAFTYRFPLLLKEELENEELGYLKKCIEIELMGRMAKNKLLYANHNIKFEGNFSQTLIKRNGNTYLDLYLSFYYNDDDRDYLRNYGKGSL